MATKKKTRKSPTLAEAAYEERKQEQPPGTIVSLILFEPGQDVVSDGQVLDAVVSQTKEKR